MLTNWLAGAILLLTLAGLSTQWLALATGRDFVFGLIPKFNPAGSRNIPVWFASVAFTACSAFAAVTALACWPSGSPVGRRWRALAVMLAVSAERSASIIRFERLTSGTDRPVATTRPDGPHRRHERPESLLVFRSARR